MANTKTAIRNLKDFKNYIELRVERKLNILGIDWSKTVFNMNKHNLKHFSNFHDDLYEKVNINNNTPYTVFGCDFYNNHFERNH